MPKRDILQESQPSLTLPSNSPLLSLINLNQTNHSIIPSSSSNTPKPKPTEQKRRRVTRACDNCRQKKVKCDGKQPCIHCTVYSYNCTYDQPNIRNKKNTGIPIPSYPQNNPAFNAVNANSNLASNTTSPLSMNQLNSLVASPLLQSLTSSDINIKNNNLELCQKIMNLILPKVKFNLLDDKPQQFDFDKFQKVFHYIQNKNPSNVSLNEISDLYQDGPTPITSPISRHERQSSVSSNDENALGREIKIMLPSKEVALQLIYTTWYKACVLFRFYHRPSLLEEVELLYSLDPFNYTDRQQKFLPFLYSILACGSLFSKLSKDSKNNESLEDDGFRYFLEARKLIDITNVGDIISIQTIVMMIMYLQCSARLSTCYSYIGIALRSAVKEGLHRNLSIFQNSKRKLDPIEVDTRKRLFFTIYKMDIYINSLLGLPRSISEDEFDQEFPEELDDENITRDSYLYDNQQGRLSSSGCANHHTKLMLIISHIVKELYPIKVKNHGNPDHVSPGHIHNKVTDIELELKQWLENLPAELKPTDPNNIESSKNIPEKFLLANYYLHLGFLNCQIMLYRPFIHFISNGVYFQASDPRSLIRGRNCIKVARMVVKLANKMIDQDLLVGTYWFSMYTIFFSIACLIYYFHFANYNNNQGHKGGVNYAGVLFDDDLNIDMIKKDIEIGKKVLDCLKHNSNSSLRIYNILNNLFEQLNRRTANTSRVKNNPLMTQSTFEANDASVQSTFHNFDRMNDFNQPDGPLSQNNYDQYSSSQPELNRNRSNGNLRKYDVKKEDDDSLKAFLLKGNLQDNYTELADPSRGQNSNEKSPSKNNNESPKKSADDFSGPIPTPSSAGVPNGSVPMNNNYSGNVDYLPGVIDTLDAQIFGRILPPYMLEKSAKRAEGADAASNGYSSKNDSKPSQNNDYRSKFDDNTTNNNRSDSFQSQQNVPGPGLNLDDFDLSMLGDNNTLDYLDPFNPINNESPYDFSKQNN
ncbi:hypothetical protein HYPBUDRAFT_6756 [Hyphopichia burtonii NRRL Y-1933]|uniref:Zn(2)-C6 fungal-type domain-containing protein n=1 Tax=Hyphopichia burtonii NRRL Y-1933 TaxID=984485 RepID=A0A1E4RGK2_9ASCO|nr:hypothetical protein HYPBUDRAFT_6756 [Hyphopichia burtonii NRRL Y-1933]ODV66346.1 hypothetical protein HYPBUDRAFT_6756 [Hyphopichia burtonii NRRL Y-1933]